MARTGDKIGHQRMVIIASFIAAVFFVPQGIVTSFWQLVALNLLAGLCVGALTPSLSALLVKNSESGTEGSVYGFDNSIVAAGRAVAPLVGSFIALQLNYRITFVAAGLVFLGMGIIAYMIPE